MAITSFIPKLWSARLLANLEKSHVATAFTNHDYEGDIQKMGDTVHINTIGDITVKDFTRNTDIDDPEILSTDDQTLVIDQGKYFNFSVDDVDRVQAAGPLMDAAMKNAAYQIADVVDKKIFTVMDAAIPASNVLGTAAAPLALSASDAYDALVDLGVKLDEANVPAAGRKIAVPPAFEGLLRKDQRFVGSGNDAAEDRLVNALVGRAAGFDVYKSNNLPVVEESGAVTGYKAIAGIVDGTTFAEQIVEMEAYRPEKRFADAVKGLEIYGVKVIRPACLGEIIFTLE